MRASVSVFVLLLAVLLGYLFYMPVPDEAVDQVYYRLLNAGIKAVTLVSSIRAFIQPGDTVFFETFAYVSDLPMPAGDLKVQGSNVETRYTEFDRVRVLISEPIKKKKGLNPGMVYYHGGGYAIGSTKSHAPLTRYFAESLDMVVVSVEYRLAPVHPFPAAFEDCFTATKWFLNHASDFGVDAHRVVVAGDSAGGHMSAIVTHHVHDDPTLPNVKLHVLFYPWIQVFDFHTPSYRAYEEAFGDTGVIAKPRVAEFMSSYLLGRLDQPFMDKLMLNAHTSEEFKKSGPYRKVLNHKIIAEELGRALPHNTGFDKTGRKVDTVGNATLWAEIKDRLLDPRFSPLFRRDFKGLSPAFIATADLDSIRDDGIFYARVLREAGVQVTWKNYQGAWHGIVAVGPIKNIPTGVKIVNDAIDFIRENI